MFLQVVLFFFHTQGFAQTCVLDWSAEGSCSPSSPFIETLDSGEDLSFCENWNPDFAFRGFHCCSNKSSLRKRGGPRCSPRRAKSQFCDERTLDQLAYTEAVQAGKLGNILDLLKREIGRKSNQAYCSVNDGFLAWGRALVPTPENRVELRAPQKCTNFGTDEMVAMLEWLGREVAKGYHEEKYSKARLLIGDVSAPRGGCLSGRGGRRGHRSHTTGQDVDIGYLTVKDGQESPHAFHQKFDATVNAWVLKKLFKNPFACVQVIFLDRMWIKKLSKNLWNDPDWKIYRKYIKHVRGHRNHFHVRIGGHPGEPGCLQEPEVNDLEEEEENEAVLEQG